MKCAYDHHFFLSLAAPIFYNTLVLTAFTCSRQPRFNAIFVFRGFNQPTQTCPGEHLTYYPMGSVRMDHFPHCAMENNAGFSGPEMEPTTESVTMDNKTQWFQALSWDMIVMSSGLCSISKSLDKKESHSLRQELETQIPPSWLNGLIAKGANSHSWDLS